MFMLILNILISLFLLLGCSSKKPDGSFGQDDPDAAENQEGEEAQTKEDDPSSDAFTLPSCSGNDCCYKSTKCSSQCENLFPLMENKSRCLKLPVAWVAKMQETVNNNLKDPKWDNLVYMELPVFWSVLKISEKPWLDKISSYHYTEARKVLFWLASKPDISTGVLSHLPSYQVRAILLALFRKNTRSVLLDDNALLSGLKEPVEIEEKYTFFKVADKENNSSLISLVHKEVISGHLCDYSINQPKPVHYTSDRTYPACVLAVYCYITGSYEDDSYLATQNGQDKGQVLRERLAGELENQEKEVKSFIQEPHAKGGLGIEEGADNWPDAACVKLKQLWDDGNLKFGLQNKEPEWWDFPEFQDAYYWE